MTANTGFPSWLKKRWPAAEELNATWRLLHEIKISTVCESANCPNLGECFAHRIATFMILGPVCTRNCRFCAVAKGKPGEIDFDEPRKVAEASLRLGLKHVVVTSVTRDDLPDRGAGQFVATIHALRETVATATMEVLTPDFGGQEQHILNIVKAGPDIYNHNVETVPRLYRLIRPGASYRLSLGLLELVKKNIPAIYIKSGLMVGLGETVDEVRKVMEDLRRARCDILTIGQYLQPSSRHFPVAEFITPERFAFYEKMAYDLGFLYVQSGPFVRSSYHAAEFARAHL